MRGLWFAMLLPALNVLQSWYQGALVHSRRTCGVTEAILVFLVVTSGILWAGAAWGRFVGLYVGPVALTVGRVVQTGWL